MKGKILIVDDEQMILDITSAYFDPSCCDVYTADNLKDAVNLWHKIRPDVTILDMVLGEGVTGIDFLKAIDPSCKTRIVMFTGFPGDYIEEAFSLGVSAHIKKPASMAEVVSVVKRYIVHDDCCKKGFAKESKGISGTLRDFANSMKSLTSGGIEA